ncbi:hypothetical protein ACOME3_009313 [Neoechinorhynchus agilis]
MSAFKDDKNQFKFRNDHHRVYGAPAVLLESKEVSDFLASCVKTDNPIRIIGRISAIKPKEAQIVLDSFLPIDVSLLSASAPGLHFGQAVMIEARFDDVIHAYTLSEIKGLCDGRLLKRVMTLQRRYLFNS